MQSRSIGMLLGCFLGALALSSAGCEGCLGLDKYETVPTGGASGASGTGGVSGSTGDCGVPGTLFVSASQEAGATSGDASDPCALTAPAPPGIEVRAFDPDSRTCLGRTRLLPSKGTLFESLPRVRFNQNRVALVTATFRGGSLSLPARCELGDNIVVEEAPGATDTMMLAELLFDGKVFCTAWIDRAFTTEPGAKLRLGSYDRHKDGSVAVTGSLGGALVQFEAAGSLKEVRGGPFFVRYLADGSLVDLTVEEAKDPLDTAMAALPRGGDWLVTGSVKREQPACHGCAGLAEVIEPAAVSCPSMGGTGGSAGTTGTGATGGSGGSATSTGSGGTGTSTGSGGSATTGSGGSATTGSGGSGGSGATGGTGGTGGSAPASSDTQNAFLWAQPASGGSCRSFSTFGSDRLGGDDRQAGMGLALVPGSSGCTTYWAGLAGRDAWRFGSADSTLLFNAGGGTMDGFLARLESPSGAACSDSPALVWNMRLTPAAGAAIGERVSAEEHCATFGDLAATAFVRSAAGGTLSLYRCGVQDGCASNAPLVDLSTGNEQHLVVLGLDSTGVSRWSMALGPVKADDEAAAGTFAGRSHHDIARDSRDEIYLVFTTTGPLSLKNLQTTFDCNDLVNNLAAGTYLIALRAFSGDQAQCEWAERIGP